MNQKLFGRKIRGKSVSASLALIFVLTVSPMLVALPLASAHTPAWNVPTYAYIEVTPNPVGVNQQVLILMWLDKPPPTASGPAGDRWQNFTVTVTKPDGTTEMLGPFTSDPTATTYTPFTPTETGTYTLLFTFPGQTAALANPITGVDGAASPFVGDYYMPSNATTTLTVQQQQVTNPPLTPAPTGYWTRPIQGYDTAWASVASNWLNSPPGINDNVQPYGTAPSSAHVMWTIPLQNGGVVGGSYNSAATKFGQQPAATGYTYYAGGSYEGRFPNPIIIQGVLYYSIPLSNNPTGGGYAAVDLRTGNQLWVQNYNTTTMSIPLFGIYNLALYPTFGQLYGYDSPNQHGVVPNGYLWSVSGSTWMAYDAMTGDWLFNLTGVPSGTNVYGPSGEILRYILSPTGTWLAEWNNTAAPGELGAAITPGQTPTTGVWCWRPVGKVIDASTAYSWNITLPTAVTAGSTILQAIPGDLLLIATPLTASYAGLVSYGTNPYTIWAISLQSSNMGQVLWTKNYQPPAGNVTRQFVFANQQTGMFFMLDRETMSYYGYSLQDGSLVWGPFTLPRGFDYYSSTVASYNQGCYAVDYGNLYLAGWGGIVYCVNATTGTLEWTYGNGGVGNSTNSGTITPWGNYPTFIGAVADGKVYMFNSEHSPIAPPAAGEEVRCINAYTGQELWTLPGWAESGMFYSQIGAIADGYLTFFNEYDGQIYCIGKGPSQTTVSAPKTSVSVGSTIQLTGTVTDQSPGQPGTPAISDANMSAWMAYLKEQTPLNGTVTGVPVTLTAVNSNGQTTTIGQTTSDMYGNYGITWTPQAQGEYQIVANFAGDNSYGSSSSSTYVYVGTQASSPTVSASPNPSASSSSTTSSLPSPATQPSQGPPSITYIVVAAAVIIIAAIAVVAFLLRRRH